MDTRARISLKDNAAFWDGADPAEELSDFDGLDRYEARELVITLAEAQGWLDGIDAETHMVPHGDRSKVAVEPFLTDQWYVDAATLARPALAAVRDGRTRILPERDEKTYFHWLENIEPWCISRQLWWGHRDPGLVRPHASEGRTIGDAVRLDEPTRRRDASVVLRVTETRCCRAGRAYYGDGSMSSCDLTGSPDAEMDKLAKRTRIDCVDALCATPTSSTPGSPPASGRSARSAGRRTRRSSAATTRPASSSPASTSSSSGSRG